MRHRHPGTYRSRTPKGFTTYKTRPMHTQTLIFPKSDYNRKTALAWAKKHGFKHYTAREEDDTIRVRQFPPEDVERYGGTYPMGDVKGVYAEVNRDKYKNKKYEELRRKFNISKYKDDDKDGVPNWKDCKPWDKRKQDKEREKLILRGFDSWKREFSRGNKSRIEDLQESKKRIDWEISALQKEISSLESEKRRADEIIENLEEEKFDFENYQKYVETQKRYAEEENMDIIEE